MSISDNVGDAERTTTTKVNTAPDQHKDNKRAASRQIHSSIARSSFKSEREREKERQFANTHRSHSSLERPRRAPSAHLARESRLVSHSCLAYLTRISTPRDRKSERERQAALFCSPGEHFREAPSVFFREIIISERYR